MAHWVGVLQGVEGFYFSPVLTLLFLQKLQNIFNLFIDY